jgi:chromosome partitioning protein
MIESGKWKQAAGPNREPSGAGDPFEESLLAVRLDLKGRPLPNGKVVAFANEKGGVGKTTLAFHTCVALCHAGKRVLAIDLDHRQGSLSHALENRDVVSRKLRLDLPRPTWTALVQQSGSMLIQEIQRLGAQADFIILDLQGADSRVGRRAIAIADQLVTPVNSSALDLGLLARFDPIGGQFRRLGPFGQLISDIRSVRQSLNFPPLDWLVVPNRLQHAKSRNSERFAQALQVAAEHAQFRIADGFGERLVFRELFAMGLTALDLPLMPQAIRAPREARDELSRFLSCLGFDQAEDSERPLSVRGGTT